MESLDKLKACVDMWYEAARNAMESNDMESMKEIDARFEELNGRNVMERIEVSLKEIRETMRFCKNEIVSMNEDVRKLTEERESLKKGSDREVHKHLEEVVELKGRCVKTRKEYQREYQRAYRLKKKEEKQK